MMAPGDDFAGRLHHALCDDDYDGKCRRYARADSGHRAYFEQRADALREQLAPLVREGEAERVAFTVIDALDL